MMKFNNEHDFSSNNLNSALGNASNKIDKNNIPDTLNDAIIIGNHSELFNDSFQVISDSSYFHNPYVNRMWPEIYTFRLSK